MKAELRSQCCTEPNNWWTEIFSYITVVWQTYWISLIKFKKKKEKKIVLQKVELIVHRCFALPLRVSFFFFSMNLMLGLDYVRISLQNNLKTSTGVIFAIWKPCQMMLQWHRLGLKWFVSSPICFQEELNDNHMSVCCFLNSNIFININIKYV